MNNMQVWDYEQSIARVKPMVINWRNLTVELVEELYKARSELSSQGRRSDIMTNVTKSWNEYLNEVGLEYRTVHRWLERYEPEERRLMEPEEVEQRKQIETRAKQQKHIAIRQRINTAINTGTKPLDWDDETEKEYIRELRNRADRTMRIEESRRKIEEDRIRKQKEQEKIKYDEEMKIKFDEVQDELLRRATNELLEKHRKRETLKDRFRLSQQGNTDVFIDALMDYLDELPDDNRRIEACNNIIKVCRNISVELQRSDK
jgi:hypothetical protein